MELKNIYRVSYIVDGFIETDDLLFLRKKNAEIRKNKLESKLSVQEGYECSSIDTILLVRDKEKDCKTLWMVYSLCLSSGKMETSPLFNSKERAEELLRKISSEYPNKMVTMKSYAIEELKSNATYDKIGTFRLLKTN